MNDDIIRMAREAGLHSAVLLGLYDGKEAALTDSERDELRRLERFAALVIANNPPQTFMSYQEGYAAGVAAEQDRCCRIIFGMAGSDNVAQRTVDAIKGKPQRATLTKPCGSLGEDIDNPSF